MTKNYIMYPENATLFRNISEKRLLFYKGEKMPEFVKYNKYEPKNTEISGFLRNHAKNTNFQPRLNEFFDHGGDHD